MPVPSNDELGTIQKLSSIQISLGEIGAFQCRFEEVRTLQTGTGQIRITEVRSPQIGTPKIRPSKIERGQIEPAQGSPR